MRLLSVVVFGLFLYFISFASGSSELAQANGYFAKEAYSYLSNNDGNIFFSPLSIHTLMSLLYQGARGNTTLIFQKVLKVPEQAVAADGYKDILTTLNKVENVSLNIANKVYIKTGYPLNKNFKDVAIESFASEVESIDFAESAAASDAINNWVENKTNNKIKNLVNPDMFNGDTRMALINAIYFKGSWLNKFKKTRTIKAPFFITENDTIECQMMHTSAEFFYSDNRDLNALVLEMPYINDDVKMVVILPKNAGDIKSVEKKIGEVDLTSILRYTTSRRVNLQIPKFKIKNNIDLQPLLTDIGLRDIFHSPDLSGLIDYAEPLYVSRAVHKSFIEVNEEGAEAAAASAGIVSARSMLIVEPVQFKADHPFILAIVHKNQNILFMGRISKPEWEEQQ